ncbi:MAG: bifunctional riboflavin kinase/FAD synthetase [Proteobacteria bacterium]|nr:bifunctional riboflavin kinase/FAD synthetase [Pseudomonadota bacterium]
MQLFRHPDNLPDAAKGAVVAWGNFDGFHKGHQAVLRRAATLADELGAPLAVLTTEPHPRQFFQPDAEPFRLMSLRSKAQALGEFGVDYLYVLNFDTKMAGMLAQDFVMETLIGQLDVRHIVTGHDQRFGKGRGGGTSVLRWMGEMEGFDVTVVDPLHDGDDVYSSTRIRDHLRNGQPGKAAEMMGHWWHIEGRVEKGDQRGRTIGFPTANLSWLDYLEPVLGVYAVGVHIEEGEFEGMYKGVANLGMRPTFDKESIIFEAHLFDFDGDIYGVHLGIDIIDFIRPEMKFDGLDSLKAQIAADCDTARKLLAHPVDEPGRYGNVTRD